MYQRCYTKEVSLCMHLCMSMCVDVDMCCHAAAPKLLVLMCYCAA